MAGRVLDFTKCTDQVDLSDFGFGSVAAARAAFADAGADRVFTFGAAVLLIKNMRKSELGVDDHIL